MLGQMFNALVNQAANNATNNRGGGGGGGAAAAARGGGRGNFQNNQNNRGGNTGGRGGVPGSIHSRLGNANIGLMNKNAKPGNQIGLMNKDKADAPTEENNPVVDKPEAEEAETPKTQGANIGLMNKPNPSSRWGNKDNQEEQKDNQNQGSKWGRGGGNQDNRGSWSRGGGNQGGKQQQDNAEDTPKENFGGRGGGGGRGRGGRGGNLGNLDDEGRGGGRGGRDEGGRGGSRGGGRGGRDEGGRGGGRGGRDEGGRGGGRGGDRGGRGRGGWGDRRDGRGDWVQDKLKDMAGPQIDLPPREEVIRKFSNNCRLWIGNIPTNTEEEEVKALFEPHGEFDEFYFDKNKGFGFIRMDYKANAEKAKLALNGQNFNGRQLKLRISPPGTALKVRNLSSCVTNELLEKAFGVFGDLERAHVYVDERGRSTGEGMVEFCKKPSATNCLKRCTDGCFILSASPRPVIVEPMPVVDDTEGFSEINVNRRNYEFQKERQEGPRLGTPGSFEYEYGQKWKQLYDLFDKKKESLEKQMADEKVKLEEQMEFAKYDHETEMLREKLKVQEEINQRNKMEFEQRQKLWEENRVREEAYSQTQTEELERKYWAQEDDLRRRQEENRRYLQETADGLKGKEDSYGGGYGGDNDRKRGFSDSYGGSGGNGYSEMTGQRGGGGGGGAAAAADTVKGFGGDTDRFGSGKFNDNRGSSDFGGSGYGRGGMDDQYGRGGAAATEDDFQAKRARY